MIKQKEEREEKKEKRRKKREEKRMSLSTVDFTSGTVDFTSGTVRTSNDGMFYYSMRMDNRTERLIVSNLDTDPYVELSTKLMEEEVRYCNVHHMSFLDDNGNKYYSICSSNGSHYGNENNYFLLVHNQSEDCFRIVKYDKVIIDSRLT